MHPYRLPGHLSGVCRAKGFGVHLEYQLWMVPYRQPSGNCGLGRLSTLPRFLEADLARVVGTPS